MNSDDIGFYVLSTAAAATALVLDRLDRRHRPIAALFLFGLIGDAAQRQLRPLFAEAARPFSGMPRLAWTVKESIFTAYVPAVVAVCLIVLIQAPRWSLLLPAVAWGGVVAAHVFGYPALRGAELGAFYRDVQVASVVALLAMAVRFEVARRRERRSPSTTELLALWSVAVEVINLAGPYLRDPWTSWNFARVAYGTLFGFATFVQIVAGGTRWRRRE